MGTIEPQSMWVVIRKDESREYIDTSTLSYAAGNAKVLADMTDRKLPHWAAGNPQQRLIRVTIAPEIGGNGRVKCASSL